MLDSWGYLLGGTYPFSLSSSLPPLHFTAMDITFWLFKKLFWFAWVLTCNRLENHLVPCKSSSPTVTGWVSVFSAGQLGPYSCFWDHVPGWEECGSSWLLPLEVGTLFPEERHGCWPWGSFMSQAVCRLMDTLPFQALCCLQSNVHSAPC